MKTVIMANTLLLLSVGLLAIAPTAGAVATTLIIYASKHYRPLGRMWMRYYRTIIKLENQLFK